MIFGPYSQCDSAHRVKTEKFNCDGYNRIRNSKSKGPGK